MSYLEEMPVIMYCPSQMKLVAKLRKWCIALAFVFAFLGYATPSSAADVVLSPAYFEEGVKIWYWPWAQGASTSVADSIYENHSWDLGQGEGWAIASNILPGSAQAGLELDSYSGMGGWGGSAYVWMKYFYAVVPEDPFEELPDTVPLILSTFGEVSVSTDLVDIGGTFARVICPAGQFEASNMDAYGVYQGYFSFDKSVTVNTPVNTAQMIEFYLITHGQGSGSWYYDSYAFADPTVVIDPAFEYADQFKIIYSEGMSPVPIPTSLLLLGSGLAGLARLKRKLK